MILHEIELSLLLNPYREFMLMILPRYIFLQIATGWKGIMQCPRKSCDQIRDLCPKSKRTGDEIAQNHNTFNTRTIKSRKFPFSLHIKQETRNFRNIDESVICKQFWVYSVKCMNYCMHRLFQFMHIYAFLDGLKIVSSGLHPLLIYSISFSFLLYFLAKLIEL